MPAKKKISDMALEELTAEFKLSLEPMFKDIHDKLDEITSAVSSSKKSIEVLERKYEYGRQKLSEFEQRERSRSFRIFNLELSQEQIRSPARLSRYLYDKLFRPCLEMGKELHLIQDVPPEYATVEYCHVIGKPTTAPDGSLRPPPVICRLHSRITKYVILNTKKRILEDYNRSLTNPVRIVEDMSQDNRNLLRRVGEIPEVCQAFFHGQKVKFKTRDSPDTVKTVRNPLGQTVSELQQQNPLLLDD